MLRLELRSHPRGEEFVVRVGPLDQPCREVNGHLVRIRVRGRVRVRARVRVRGRGRGRGRVRVRSRWAPAGSSAPSSSRGG